MKCHGNMSSAAGTCQRTNPTVYRRATLSAMSPLESRKRLGSSTAIGVSRFSPVWRFTCRVNGGFILILGLNRRYMPRCVGNLNNQG